MKSSISILFFILFNSLGFSQEAFKANTYFDRFEYDLASEHYKVVGVKTLTTNDLLKYIYSAYAIGDFKEVVLHAEPLLNDPETAPFFHWAFAQSNSAMGKHNAAIEGYKRYKGLVQKDLDFVDLRIKSSEVIDSWKSIDFIQNDNDSQNFSKGDLSGYVSEYGQIRYQEIGLDSISRPVKTQQINDAEILLLKPLLLSSEVKNSFISIPDSFALASINSISFIPNSKNIFLSLSQPIHPDTILHLPHIYIGKYNTGQNSISDVKLWDYSGMEDSSSCAHVTVNWKGNIMAFSKKSYQNQYSDIYISQYNDGNWNKPQPLQRINSQWNEMFPLFQRDGKLSFSSNGRIGYGKLDIYIYDFQKGQITHLKTPINSAMDDFNYFKDTNNHQAKYSSNRKGGSGDDDIYTIEFEEKKVVAALKNQRIQEPLIEDLHQSFYFKFDERIPKNLVTIDSSVLRALGNNTDLYIQLDCHADKRGANEYNERLSKDRGGIIKKELLQLGVSPEQISILPFGENRPPIECVKCDEEQHAKNRVVILSIHKTKEKNAL
tara:strand:- start:4740 stop:6383 length:1644 start_codon:yes stop_codon:yes gene_type:complete